MADKSPNKKKGGISSIYLDMSKVDIKNSAEKVSEDYKKVDSDKKQEAAYKDFVETSGGSDAIKNQLESFYSIMKDSKLLGMPFHFNNLADPIQLVKYASGDMPFGRTFLERIVREQTLVIFEPGKPIYMGAKAPTFAEEAAMKVGDMVGLAALTEARGQKAEITRFYGFETAYVEYINTVRVFANLLAARMGLGSDTTSEMNKITNDKDLITTLTDLITGKTKVMDGMAAEFETMNKNGKLKLPSVQEIIDDITSLQDPKGTSGKRGLIDSLISAFSIHKKCIAFYVGNSTNYSEEGSNTTGESAFSGMVKSVSGMSKDINFILGKSVGDVGKDGKVDKGLIEKAVEAVTGFLSNTLGKVDTTGTTNRIHGLVESFFSGGNLLFPEIWQDSTFRRSYSVNIKLSTPYGDRMSIFQNLYLPMICLMVLSMPRQRSPQGYMAPFLVKCYSNGWFNCDLGIIESISITKGEAGWSVDGLPLSIDITLSIKDLYPTITMIPDNSFLAFKNVSFMEYLDGLAGVPIQTIQPVKNAVDFANYMKKSIDNFVPDIVEDFKSNVIKFGSSFFSQR